MRPHSLATRRTVLTGTAAAAAAAVTMRPAAPRAAESHSWKMQSLWQAGAINQEIFQDFAERIRTTTGGRIEITPLPVGSIVAYNETLDAVGNGIIEGQHGGTTYNAGKDAAFALIGDLNGGFETPWQMQMWYEYGGGLELARELYAEHGLYFVGPIWWGVESIPSKTPLNGIADLEGVKLRAPEGIGAQIFQELGANVVTLAGSEVYTALERGVIDATDWGTVSMNADLGYQKIAKFALYPGVHSMPAADIAVNMDEWNALSDDLKAIVEMAARDFARDMVERIALLDLQAAKSLRDQGVTLIDWSPEERRKFRQVARGVWGEWAGKSALAQKVYDSQVAFLEKLGLL